VKDDRLYLGHILEAAERIVLYGRDGEESFRTDLRTQDAIIRNLQVMGEAVKKVSLETREAHPDIPWKDIAGMRDSVVHDYFGVSLERAPVARVRPGGDVPALGGRDRLGSRTALPRGCFHGRGA